MAEILTEIEKSVYPYIQDFLSSNRLLEVSRLTSYLKVVFANTKKVNLNKEGISHTIENLMDKKVIFEGTRLTRDEILINAKRNAIYTYICENPGVYHYQIVKELGLANHIINWHIQALLQFDFIKELRIDNHQLYYDSNYAEDRVINNYYSRNEKSNQILDYLKKQPEGCSKTQLAKELGMHPLTIKKYTDELVKNAFIVKKNSGPKLFINENLTTNSHDIRIA